MAIQTHEVASIQAKRLRAIRLEPGGAPDVGADGLLVTDALISAQVGVETEAGAEFIQKNGGGGICVNFKGDDRIKRATLTLNLCQLDSELLSMLVGGTIIDDNGQTIGLDLPDESADLPRVAIEIWSAAWEGSAQSVSSTQDPVHIHWVFPRCQFTMGQFTIEEGILTVPVTGNSTSSPVYGNGPDGSAPLPFYITGPLAWYLDDDPLPDVTNGFAALVGS